MRLCGSLFQTTVILAPPSSAYLRCNNPTNAFAIPRGNILVRHAVSASSATTQCHHHDNVIQKAAMKQMTHAKRKERIRAATPTSTVTTSGLTVISVTSAGSDASTVYVSSRLRLIGC